MREENVYVIADEDEGLMLRIVKVSPFIEGSKFSYGGVKIEIVEILKDENGKEKYDTIIEFYLTMEEALMVGNVLTQLAMECLNEMRNVIAMANMLAKMRGNNGNKDKMYM